MSRSEASANRIATPLALRVAALASLCVVAAIGCSDGMARVEGVVRLDGEPVNQTETVRCDVTLKPTAGGPAATGTVDRGGRFRLAVGSSRSIPPGDYKASVRVREVTPPAQPGGYSSSQDLAPEQYASTATSGLAYTLQPGGNEIEIEIDSKP